MDGSEKDTVPPTSRIAGKAFLKSGTTVAGDAMNSRALIMTRGLAGYMKGKSGRDLVVAIYVMDVPLGDDMVPQLLKVIEDQGVILTAGRKGTFVRFEAAREVAKVKTGRAERLMRRLIKTLVVEGMSRREITDIFNSALSLETRKG